MSLHFPPDNSDAVDEEEEGRRRGVGRGGADFGENGKKAEPETPSIRRLCLFVNQRISQDCCMTSGGRLLRLLRLLRFGANPNSPLTIRRHRQFATTGYNLESGNARSTVAPSGHYRAVRAHRRALYTLHTHVLHSLHIQAPFAGIHASYILSIYRRRTSAGFHFETVSL